jgi:hypothetical protein
MNEDEKENAPGWLIIGRFLLLGLYGGIVMMLLSDYFPENENEEVAPFRPEIHWILMWLLWSLPWGFFKITNGSSGPPEGWMLFQSEEEEPDSQKGQRKYNWLIGGFGTIFCIALFLLCNSMLQWIGIDFWVLDFFK